MPNNSSSSDILFQSLLDSTNSLADNVSLYNLQFLNNFNFIINNLQGFNSDFNIISNYLNSLQNIFTYEYNNFLKNNITYLENLFTNIYTLSEVSNYNITDFNNIYLDIYDQNLVPVVGKTNIKIDNFSQLDNILNVTLDISDLVNSLYYLKIYYNDDNSNYLFNSIIYYIQSSDKVLERYQFDNNSLNISKDLANYKIYLLDVNGRILNSKYIVKSVIGNGILDLQCFSLFENIDNSDLSKYQFFIKKENFTEIWTELKLEDYSAGDIGNVLLGNAQRDLNTGVFTVYNSDGSILSQNVSTRFVKTETRKKL